MATWPDLPPLRLVPIEMTPECAAQFNYNQIVTQFSLRALGATPRDEDSE